MPESMDAARWRPYLTAWALLVLAVGGLYAHTLVGMAGIWARSETYAHGFVVPLISAWLVWRLRAEVRVLTPRPAPLAWLLMAGAAALWLAGDLVAVNAATQLAFVSLLVLTVPAVMGWAVARRLMFPLGFLFFAVPIGDFMLPRLMEWTADFTVLALRASGVPVYREGLQFVIPSGTWSVVEACSGIRYLIASVTVGCLFAHLSYQGWKKKLLFVGVSIAVPLVANWLRAYMIVMLGHLSGNELATGVDHLIYGWLFFGVVIALMLFIGARWADAPAPGTTTPRRLTLPPATTASPAWRGAVVALLIALLPHAAVKAIALSNLTAPVSLASVAPQAPWAGAATPPSDWAPAFANASAQVHQGYTGPEGQRVGVHLHYYRQQDYERKLVSSENMLVRHNDATWARAQAGTAQAQWPGAQLPVASATLRRTSGGLTTSGTERLLAWRWYWVDDRFTASDAAAKLLGAWGRVRGWGDDGAIVVVYTPLDPQLTEAQAQERAQATLRAFVQANGAALQDSLRRTRAGH